MKKQKTLLIGIILLIILMCPACKQVDKNKNSSDEPPIENTDGNNQSEENDGNKEEPPVIGEPKKIGIMCYTGSNDPFLENYYGDHKAIRQARIVALEAKYNIDIFFEYYPYVLLGMEATEYTINDIETLLAKDIYIIENYNSMMPLLADYLVELYDFNTRAGLLSKYNISNVNMNMNRYLSSKDDEHNNKVYSINFKEPELNSLIWYDRSMIALYGLEDPAELWFKGEWTPKKYDEWLQKAFDCSYDKVFALSPYEHMAAKSAAMGIKMVDILTHNVNCANNIVLSELKKLNYYYDSQNPKIQCMSYTRVNGLLNSKFMIDNNGWFNSKELSSSYEDLDRIGVVPYPTINVKVITNSYEYIDSKGNKIIVDEPVRNANGDIIEKDGKAVYGIDLSDSPYMCAITSSENKSYAILNHGKEGQNELNAKLLEIIYELKSETVEMYNERISTELLNDKLNINIVKSVSNNLCYTPLHEENATIKLVSDYQKEYRGQVFSNLYFRGDFFPGFDLYFKYWDVISADEFDLETLYKYNEYILFDMPQ